MESRNAIEHTGWTLPRVNYVQVGTGITAQEPLISGQPFTEFISFMLRATAGHPAVCGVKPSPLFWFVPSTMFANPTAVRSGSLSRMLPLFLQQPEVIFQRMWATPVNDEFHSLLD